MSSTSSAPGALARASDDRLVAGVCGGVAARLGVDAMVIRLALIPLVFAGGVGVVLYLVLWGLMGDRVVAVGPHHHGTSLRPAMAVGLVVLGGLLLLRSTTLWLGDSIVWPVAMASLGSGVMWTRGGDASRTAVDQWLLRWRADGPTVTGMGDTLREIGIVRLLAGATMIVAGMAAFLAANDGLSALTDTLLAVFVVTAGAALVLGPWFVRLAGQLANERRERIRTEERAAVAAHLHDSVLQTLALIQRAADQPARARAIARRQERELRAWLYGTVGEGVEVGPATAGEAIQRIVTEVEDQFDVRVEAVIVGDVTMDEPATELLGAVREAVTNAAKHAGTDEVSVYLEGTGRSLTAFVRDRGIGFDPGEVAQDRHGVRHSIRGRLERAKGTASVTTAPGEGTEWELSVPRQARPNASVTEQGVVDG